MDISYSSESANPYFDPQTDYPNIAVIDVQVVEGLFMTSISAEVEISI